MMKLTGEKILNLINQGENKTVEFKSHIVSEHEISKVLTAFANTEGGYLFFGVSEESEIIGLNYEESEMIEMRLTKICNSLFKYPYEVGVIGVKGRTIVFVYVEKVPDHLKPVVTSRGEYYIREGNSNVIEGDMSVEAKKNDIKKSLKRTHEDLFINGFVAMSFREEEEPVLVDYFNAMKRAVQSIKLPIKLNRIDLKEGDFEISQQLMEEIKNSDFVIADITLEPHNVYFELGYSRGIGKKIIQTARKGTALQFDIRNWKTIFYRNATELEEKLKPALIQVYNDLTT